MQQSRAEQIQVSPQVCETLLCKFFPFYMPQLFTTSNIPSTQEIFSVSKRM